jgi:hypothetical protein
VRLGPEEFDSMAIDGMCGTHGDMAPAGPDDRSANLNMLAYHAPECPTCSTRAWKIHFDGGAPIAGPQYPQPQPQAGAPAQSCNDSMRQEFDQHGMEADVADLGLALARKPKLELAEKAYGACALLANNPEEAFLALCNVGRSMIPADWAYLAISQLGKSISNEDIESFGESASRSWDQQCR